MRADAGDVTELGIDRRGRGAQAVGVRQCGGQNPEKMLDMTGRVVYDFLVFDERTLSYGAIWEIQVHSALIRWNVGPRYHNRPASE